MNATRLWRRETGDLWFRVTWLHSAGKIVRARHEAGLKLSVSRLARIAPFILRNSNGYSEESRDSAREVRILS